MTTTGWTPLQFHFHTPSEHTFDGTSYDAEVHYVHSRTEGGTTKYLVIGVMFETAYGQPGNTDFMGELDTGTRTEARTYSSINNVNFLNKIVSGEFYHYEGSLTTPPCTERVNFFILRVPQYISAADLTNIQAAVPNSNRDI